MPNETILVVDDEIANLQKLRRTLVNRYRVLAAGSGREGLELVAANEDIAVIIADQRMPDMTGIEFLRRTLEPLPQAIRIILTGYTDVDVLMEAINSCKVFRYIVKPWAPPDLLMTVERGLDAQRLLLENERFRRELVRRERLARELEIAREIQRYILPPRCPAPEGFEMAVHYHPAREVGGDLYDFQHNTDSRTLQIVIGDVSGKSIPAALYGAVFSGQVKTLFPRAPRPGEMLRFLNASLLSNYEVSNYIAVASLHVDLETGRGLIANGGMPYPFLVRDGEVSSVESSGVPLGLLPEAVYDESPFELCPGDLLILASDGATDAVNPLGLLYDSNRFTNSIRKHAGKPATALVESLYHDILSFGDGSELPDDVTIMALRRKSLDTRGGA